MKRWLASIVCLVVVSVAAIPASAQTRGRRNLDNGRVQNTRVYQDSRVRNDAYRNQASNDYQYNDDYYYGNDRSVWDRSRDKITTAIGAGAGAAIGAIVGGKKGAIIGAIAGGGGAALYTYKIRDQYPRY